MLARQGAATAARLFVQAMVESGLIGSDRKSPPHYSEGRYFDQAQGKLNPWRAAACL